MPTTIKLSRGDGTYESPNDYGDCFIQGGTSGIVFTHDPENPSYSTAFIEVFPEGSFIRGEGRTLQEADAACWEKYSALQSCSEHEYEPRGYTNGGGFCVKCRQFFGKAFTGEQLGQLCDVCGVGCLDHHIKSTGKWYCKDHNPLKAYSELHLSMFFCQGIFRRDRSDDINYYTSSSIEFMERSSELREVINQRRSPDPALLAYFDQFEVIKNPAQQ